MYNHALTKADASAIESYKDDAAGPICPLGIG